MMELELASNRIGCYDTVVHTTLSQEETQEAIVPDACPDILRIIEVCGRACLTNKQVRDGTATISGMVDTTVLYCPEGGGAVCHMDVRIPFQCQVDSDGLTSRSELRAIPHLRCADARVLNPRKILLRVDICIEVVACQPCELAVKSGINNGDAEGIQQRKEENESYIIIGVQEKPFTFEETIRMAGQGMMGEILTTRVSPKCTEAKLIGNKLIFKGEIVLQMLMQEQSGALEVAEHQLPFSQIMEVSGGGEGGDCTVDVSLMRLDIRPNHDGDRQFEVQIDLLAQAIVRAERTISYLEDAYSTLWEMEDEREMHPVSRLEVRSFQAQTVRELMETSIPPRKIVDCWVTAGEVKTSREGTQLVMASDLCVTALYLDEDDELHSEKYTTTQGVRVDCSMEGDCHCTCHCPDEIFATPSAGGIEVRMTAQFDYLVLVQENITALSAARLTQPRKKEEGKQPSVVLRLPLPGEGLWEIAKCYGTTAQEIIRANELEVEDALPEQMLLIPSAHA